MNLAFRNSVALANRVESALMERMAAPQAPQPHPDAARGAVLFDRLSHIFGARRVEAAGRGKHRRHPTFIYAQGLGYDPLQRRMRRSTSRRMSSAEASSVLRRGLITIHHCGFSCSSCSRTASRTRRRMRLRATALPTERGTVKPMCGPLASGFRRQKAAKSEPEKRLPSS